MKSPKIKLNKCTFQTNTQLGWVKVKGYKHKNIRIYQAPDTQRWHMIAPVEGVSIIKTATLKQMRMLIPYIAHMVDPDGSIQEPNKKALSAWRAKHTKRGAYESTKPPTQPPHRATSTNGTSMPMPAQWTQAKRKTLHNRTGWVEVDAHEYKGVFVYTIAGDWCCISPHHGQSFARTSTLEDAMILVPYVAHLWEPDGTIDYQNLVELEAFIKYWIKGDRWSFAENLLPDAPAARYEPHTTPSDVATDDTPTNTYTGRKVEHDGVVYYRLIDIKNSGGPSLYASDFKVIGDGSDPLAKHRHPTVRALSIEGLHKAMTLKKGTQATRQTLSEIIEQITGQSASTKITETKAYKDATKAFAKAGAALAKKATQISKEIMGDCAKLNPQATTINWQSFVVGDEVRGVSLRALVNAGLYSEYRHAAKVLQDTVADLIFVEPPKTQTPGRPGEDILIPCLKDAQKFAARARSDVGERIFDLIIDHHNELQLMLSGDEQAHQRHEQASAIQPTGDSLDALAQMVNALIEQRNAMAKMDERLEAVEKNTIDIATQFGSVIPSGHMTAMEVASHGGWLSMKGRPHSSAMIAVARKLNLEQRGLMYAVHVPVHEDEHTRMGKKHYFKPVGMALVLQHVEENKTQHAGMNAYTINANGCDWALKKQVTST